MGKPRSRSRSRQLSLERSREKKRKRMVVVFGAIMIFLMVFSVASYVVFDPSGAADLTYGDYEFSYEERANGGGVLVTQINGQQVEFQNLPIQVQHLQVDPQAISVLKSAPQVAMAADPDLPLEHASIVDYARFELAIAIPKMVSTMTKPSEQYQLPVLNCTDATAQTPVLYFNITNATPSVVADEYCITLSGEQRTLLQLKDRIIFEYYDILQDGQVVQE